MPDGIRRFNFFCSPDDRYVHPFGGWVRFSDVQARLEAADRLAAAAEPVIAFCRSLGLRPDGDAAFAVDELASDLAVYRSVGKDQEDGQ